MSAITPPASHPEHPPTQPTAEEVVRGLRSIAVKDAVIGELVRVDVEPSSLYITHIFDGEEVVRGGYDGQVHIATFSSYTTAYFFVEQCKQFAGYVNGVRASTAIDLARGQS